ncbi:MAG: hypothetical protein H0W11_01745 [Gemmatimonadetes bacterium]|nr:hypothetical protein [Gemmatimonadota bacterium]MBA4160011.1 hypothetical protein [Gemmatimonadota bacterium]
MTDPSQVLDVLLEHMRDEEGPAAYQVQSAVYIGKHSGRLISDDDILAARDVPGGLLLTMGDGSELRLTLEPAV